MRGEDLGAVDPGVGAEADGVAEGEEEDEDDAGIVRCVISVVRVCLWQCAVQL